MKFVSIPVMAVVLIAAAFPFFLPHTLPAIGLPPALPAITSADVARGADGLFSAMARHNDGHRPYQDVRANQIALGVLEISRQVKFLPPGQQDPNSRLLCYAVKYGGEIIRIAVHAILDPVSGVGATVVINPLTPQTPYLTAFESSRQSFLEGDHISRFQRSYPGATWEEADCGQLPPGPTPLAP
ncbi:hypothetical protein HYU90_03405 [Candidatus Collierbacteria bacterium]|nr:hypothetical protein [Candidatus Collierbacteria bacterium]